MPPHLIGVMGIIGFLILAFLRLPLAFSFATMGFIGIVFLRGIVPGLSSLGEVPYSETANYVISTIPLFVLMGQFSFHSGISRDLFKAAYRWMGRFPGGLALATMLACTGFAACTGSSVASAATMGTIAFPEMERYKYNHRLSTGVIAVGGTLGILIPPSTTFIVYGIITQTSIGDLFIAGIIPGIILSSFFCGIIYIICKRNPDLGPPTESFSWKEKFSSLTSVWGMFAIFIIVIAGLYFGFFAPSEAGSIGAFGSLIVALIRRRITINKMFVALLETTKTTCFTLFTLVGAMLFNTFLTMSGLPQMVSQWFTTIQVPPIVTLIIILSLYIPLGMIIEGIAMLLLTIPFVFPIIQNLGYDPVWFGVLMCILVEFSLISPPVAINLYVVQGVTRVPLHEVARGIIPFILAYILCLALIITFPQISLFLPNTMHK